MGSQLLPKTSHESILFWYLFWTFYDRKKSSHQYLSNVESNIILNSVERSWSLSCSNMAIFWQITNLGLLNLRIRHDSEFAKFWPGPWAKKISTGYSQLDLFWNFFEIICSLKLGKISQFMSFINDKIDFAITFSSTILTVLWRNNALYLDRLVPCVYKVNNVNLGTR